MTLTDNVKKCVIFDTNYIYENKNLFFLFSAKKSDEDYFIPRLVVDEIISQNDRKIKDFYDGFYNLKNSPQNQYFNIEIELDLIKAYNKGKSNISKYFDKHFGKNIIEFYDREKMFNELLERVRFKKAPFFNTHNGTDKGFKDSLIWMSILNFAQNSEYIDFFVVTKDNGFLKGRVEELKEEFRNEVGEEKNLSIINNTEFDKSRENLEEKNDWGIDKSPIIEDDKSPRPTIIDGKTIEKYRGFVKAFFLHFEEDTFGFYESHVFQVPHIPDIMKVEDFMEILSNNEPEYFFHDFINFEEELGMIGLKDSKQIYSISHENYLNIINAYQDLKMNNNVYLRSFLNYVRDSFGQIKEQHSFEDDLPF